MISSYIQTTSYLFTTTDDDDIIIIGINKDNKFKCSDIFRLNIRYWLLLINCCLISGVILPFLNIASLYLQENYYYINRKEGNYYLMIIIIISSVFSPIFNTLIEKYGGRIQLLLLSSIILSISHFIVSGDHSNSSNNSNDYLTESYYPFIGLIGIGIAYSLFNAIIWPSFGLVLGDNPDLLSIGYCVQMSIYNLSIGIMYLVIGRLMDENWKQVNQMFIYLSITCILTVVLLWYFDEKYLKKQQEMNNNNNNNRDNNIERHSELFMSGYQH